VTKLLGRFQHLIYSPRGEIEGVLLAVADGSAQIVFDKHDEEGPLSFERLRAGQQVALEASPAGPSSKGKAVHPVYDFIRLVTVDGERLVKRRVATGPAYKGVVVRLNYARHGEPNGVVLDTGDFIHLKPDGMRRLDLKVGDAIEADGDAHLLAAGAGWAVEAASVNGTSLRD
jgi:hypothetical protein